jgi:hypothetical protein
MAINLKNVPLPLAKAALKALAEQYPTKPQETKPNRSKYGNKRTLYDGIWFDSDAESKRYATLKLWQQAGIISQLELQPQYPCVINGKKCFLYKADFRYTRDGQQVIEDVKGYRTKEYILKKKVIEALYNIEIVEVK